MNPMQAIRNQLPTRVTQAHQVGCIVDIGVDRTEAFGFSEALRRLQRKGAAAEMLSATNPLLHLCEDDDDDDWLEDEYD